jgi:hypothetical protein
LAYAACLLDFEREFFKKARDKGCGQQWAGSERI